MLRALPGLIVAAGLILSPITSVVAGYGGNHPPSDPTPSGTGAEASAGSISVMVTTSGSTTSGVPFVRSSVRSVAPVCWYGQKETGAAYYEYWKPGGVARQSPTLDDYAAQGLLNPGWESHSTDTVGHWYEATCRTDAPVDKAAAYRASHPPVYVTPADKVPVAAPDVSPETLAQVAFAAMDLPRGVIRWSPSLQGSGATVVNTDTWVWVEGAPTTVTVTAAVASGPSAQVTATLQDLSLTAPGADRSSCGPTVGVPWAAGATSTSCKIRFVRSTANQVVKAGQSLPTATLTATGTWSASWTSSADPATQTPLPTQDLVTTAEVPVAEIHTLVTTG